MSRTAGKWTEAAKLVGLSKADGERLNIAAEARGARVPMLLLQPIVENAVTHGVAHVLEGGPGKDRLAGNGGVCMVTFVPRDPKTCANSAATCSGCCAACHSRASTKVPAASGAATAGAATVRERVVTRGRGFSPRQPAR